MSNGFFHIEHVLNQKEAPTTNSSCLSVDGATSLGVGEGQVSQPQHDVPYFRFVCYCPENLCSCLDFKPQIKVFHFMHEHLIWPVKRNWLWCDFYLAVSTLLLAGRSKDSM